MSHLKYWRLPKSPFVIDADGRGFFGGGTIEEALARYEYLFQQSQKLALLIGPSGVGKSTLMTEFVRAKTLRDRRSCFVPLDLKTVTERSMPRNIHAALHTECSPVQEFDRQPSLRVEREWQDVEDTLFGFAAIRRRVVFIVDNVGHASEPTLQSLSRLQRKQGEWLILLAVNEESVVDLPRWLLDCCELRIDLPRWDLGQTADYFEFAMEQVGSPSTLFDAQSMTRIQELADGIPRRILQLAELALVAGAVRQMDRITAELIEEVFSEFSVSIGSNFSVFWENEQLNVG